MQDINNSEIKLPNLGGEMPSLTLDPFSSAAATEEPKLDVELGTSKTLESIAVDDSMLTEQEKKQVDEFSKKIDIRDNSIIMQYGAAAQQKVANFSDTALANVRTKDLGQIGGLITDLILELKGLSLGEEEKGFKGLFRRTSNKIAALKAKYDKAEVNVDKICDVLQDHQVQLLKDIAMLDKLYEVNLSYQKELTMYIIAGKKRLKQAREVELAELYEKANKSGLAEDAQAARDFADLCDRFEKKLYDLELTRMISIQMVPQIRLIQNSDSIMTEKIQSVLVNTIPLWKSQMVIALGMSHASQAMAAQREVTNVTNALLRQNADALKTSTIDVARESERGIVDLETLQHTNQQLVSTLEEVIRIQEEGKEKRRASEVELARIEAELKQKLLDLRTSGINKK